MNNDSLSLIFALIVLLVVIVLFLRVALRIRKHGGSLTTSMFASTFELYNKEKCAAMEDDEIDKSK